MNNRNLAQAFANGKTTGKGSHMFIEGDTIYSYGHHFPIATRTPRGVLLTCRRYSRSTARHISYVKSALDYSYIMAGEGDGRTLTRPTAAEVKARKAEAIKAEAAQAKREERREARLAEAKRVAPPAWAVEAVPAVNADALDPIENEVA